MDVNKQEKEILKFWKKDKTFLKSLKKTEKSEPYVFYDGPPFATGLPHYGHILASVLKDAIPRFQTMKGRYVRRVWGWDCHGLPVESIAETALGIKQKKEIENNNQSKLSKTSFSMKCNFPGIIMQYGNLISYSSIASISS